MTTILLDHFNTGSSLLGHAPDIRPAAEVWATQGADMNIASGLAFANLTSGKSNLLTFDTPVDAPGGGFVFSTELTCTTSNALNRASVTLRFQTDIGNPTGVVYAFLGLNANGSTLDATFSTDIGIDDTFTVTGLVATEYRLRVVCTPTIMEFYLNDVLRHSFPISAPLPKLLSVLASAAATASNNAAIDYVWIEGNDFVVVPVPAPAFEAIPQVLSTILVVTTALPTTMALAAIQSIVDVNSLTPLFLVPGTTWVVNSETGGSSSYSNFPFNSYSTIGGKAYGLKDDGLYLLNADQDDSGPVIGTIDLGRTHFGRTEKTRVTEGYRGGIGTLYLRMTADGKTVTYRSNRIDRGTKHRFVPGKGLTANWVSFKLLNAEDADFELKTVEFNVVKLTRRI